MEQRRQPPIYARGARALRALVQAERVPPKGGRWFKVRVHQPADQEGRQDGLGARSMWLMSKLKSAHTCWGAAPVARHVLCGLVPEDPVEGRLGGDAVSRPGMQGIRSPPQARQDLAPAGGVP